MTYDDSKLGDVKIAHDSDEMFANINSIALSNSNGEECSKPATEGLYRAIKAAPEGMDLFLFTDKNTKKSSLVNEIVTEARAKKISINFFISGSCSLSNIDSSYIKIARDTGGNVYKYEHSEKGVHGIFNLISPKFNKNFQNSDKVYSKLPTKNDLSLEPLSQISPHVKAYKINQENFAYHIISFYEENNSNDRMEIGNTERITVDHKIYVDSNVKTLMISIDMAPLGKIKLYRPDREGVSDKERRVMINSTSVNETILVDNPQAGEWRIEITGVPGTSYELDIKMNSNIRIVSFSFSQVKGRPEHKGLFPIEGQPLAEEQFVVAILAGRIRNANLVITSLDGVFLEKVVLTESTGGRENNTKKFIGKVTPPEEDFRVYIQGKDIEGIGYLRLYPTAYDGTHKWWKWWNYF